MRSAPELRRDFRFYWSRRLNRSLAPPDRVSLNVTLRCNLKCTMCTTCYDAPELSTDEVKSIIDQTAAWGVQVFNPLGGEPFMRADIEEILAYAVRRGFYVTVTTNGTLITEKRAAALAAIPSDRLHLNVSLDGNAESNDIVRGPGMWARAVLGYQRIRAADAAAGNARRKILANTLLHAQNVHHFLGVLDEQAALGFDGVQVLTLFRSSPDAVVPASEALWFTEDRLPALKAVCNDLAMRAEAQGTAGYRIENSADELRRIPRYYEEAMEPLEAPCWAGWKELYINADGRAIMCDGKLDFLAGAFGDVRQQTLQQLWADPALRKRREVVRTCRTPCIQKCYLRPESDHLTDILVDAARLGAQQVQRRLPAPSFRVSHFAETTLHVELSDVCPCDWEGCTTPTKRWQVLTKDVPERPNAESWRRLRDNGYLDFGRGFMGFDVVRSVVDDLRAARVRFGAWAVRWRGEPLLHPEVGPILRYLMAEAIGRVADVLRVETDARFLTDEVEAVVVAGGPQEWVLDLDRGDAATYLRLRALAGPGVRFVLATTAGTGRPLAGLLQAFPGLAVVVGDRPPRDRGDCLWVRAGVHPHYLAMEASWKALEEAARVAGVPAPTRPTGPAARCRAVVEAPVVSWDGKVTLCPADRTLQHTMGEVTPGSLAALWKGQAWKSAAQTAQSRGTPDRDLCRACGWPHAPHAC